MHVHVHSFTACDSNQTSTRFLGWRSTNGASVAGILLNLFETGLINRRSPDMYLYNCTWQWLNCVQHTAQSYVYVCIILYMYMYMYNAYMHV